MPPAGTANARSSTSADGAGRRHGPAKASNNVRRCLVARCARQGHSTLVGGRRSKARTLCSPDRCKRGLCSRSASNGWRPSKCGRCRRRNASGGTRSSGFSTVQPRRLWSHRGEVSGRLVTDHRWQQQAVLFVELQFSVPQALHVERFRVIFEVPEINEASAVSVHGSKLI